MNYGKITLRNWSDGEKTSLLEATFGEKCKSKRWTQKMQLLKLNVNEYEKDAIIRQQLVQLLKVNVNGYLEMIGRWRIDVLLEAIFGSSKQ